VKPLSISPDAETVNSLATPIALPPFKSVPPILYEALADPVTHISPATAFPTRTIEETKTANSFVMFFIFILC